MESKGDLCQSGTSLILAPGHAFATYDSTKCSKVLRQGMSHIGRAS